MAIEPTDDLVTMDAYLQETAAELYAAAEAMVVEGHKMLDRARRIMVKLAFEDEE